MSSPKLLLQANLHCQYKQSHFEVRCYLKFVFCREAAVETFKNPRAALKCGKAIRELQSTRTFESDTLISVLKLLPAKIQI